MALRRVDEFDGITDARVVEFSIDGAFYEIDLSDANKEQLFKDLSRYIDAARRRDVKKSATPKKTPPRAYKPAVERTADNDAIRDWAKRTGRKVSDRGRIPRDVVDAFNSEHAPKPESMFSAAQS